MQCDFCGCDLPLILATNDRDALFDKFEDTENSDPGSHLCLDLNKYAIYEFYHTEAIKPLDGYKHLCKKCAIGLDVYGAALLERDCHRRFLDYRNIAANVLHTLRGKETPPYMVAIDVGVKDRPVVQVFRKDGDRWVMTNTIVGDAVGHLMTYMEDPKYAK